MNQTLRPPMAAGKSLKAALLLTGLAIFGAGAAGQARGHAQFNGVVSLMGQPVDDAAISLWEARGGDAPKLLKTVSSAQNGGFRISHSTRKGSVHYLVAEGGRVGGASADRLTMLTVLGRETPNDVVINELTTVGSVWPNAQLLQGTALQGSSSALAISSLLRETAPRLFSGQSWTTGRVFARRRCGAHHAKEISLETEAQHERK